MRVRTHANPFSYTERTKNIDYSLLLPKNIFLDFEIGSGQGFFLKEYAIKHSERNIIGTEIRKPLFLRLKNELISQNIKNAIILNSRAEFCIEDNILDNSIDKFFIFHPDPWLKNKHHKRRIINNDFLNLMYKKLKNGGKIYISTDVETLWLDMNKIINLNKKFTKLDFDPFWEEDYFTDWSIFSKNDNRKNFFGTFCKIKL